MKIKATAFALYFITILQLQGGIYSLETQLLPGQNSFTAPQLPASRNIPWAKM